MTWRPSPAGLSRVKPSISVSPTTSREVASSTRTPPSYDTARRGVPEACSVGAADLLVVVSDWAESLLSDEQPVTRASERPTDVARVRRRDMRVLRCMGIDLLLNVNDCQSRVCEYSHVRCSRLARACARR